MTDSTLKSPRTTTRHPRLLTIASSGVGHLLPLVPSLWAARNAGAPILVGATGPAVAFAERSGLPVVDLAPGSEEEFAQIRQSYVGQMPDCPPGQRFALAMSMFADLAAIVAPAATDLAAAWQADVIMHTPLQPAGAVAATMLELPAIEHGFQLTGVGRTLHLMRDRLAAKVDLLGGKHIADPARLLDICPPSMHPGGPLGTWMGYRPYGGGGAVSADLLALGKRPRVLLSVGTSTREQDHDLMSRIVEALSRRGWDLLVAGGDADSAIEQNSDVVASGWLPFDPVLRTCDVLVHHGGAGSVLSALALGVPQIVVSGDADHAFNAAALERRGVGTGAMIDALGADGVAEAVSSLIEEPEWRRQVEDVAAEMAGTPGPSELIPKLITDT